VREAVLEPFIQAARHIGAPVEAILQSVGLPTLLTGDAEMLLPELPCWHFVQRVTGREHIPNFGLLAAQTIAHQDIASVAPLIGGCANLYELLKRLCRIAPTQSSINDYVLRDEGDIVWLEQRGFRLLADDVQVQLFEVMGIIQLVQLAAGEHWLPPTVHLTIEPCAEIENAKELGYSRVLFRQRYPAIAIPRHLLPLPILSTPAASESDTPESLSSMPGTFAGALRQAISAYLGNTDPKIELLAKVMDMPVRTLQRRLADHSLSYICILDQCRFLKAETLLRDADIKLVDISLMLGYADAATFTRAFRRWAGVAPREYRRQFLDT
jgi:AraC-like DNA-binding protein